MANIQKGFSLVELMIAITLGLVLMAGVLQMFIGSKAAYTNQRAVASVQESGRLALEFMTRDIRMAGYMGCASRSIGSIESTIKGTNFQFDMLDETLVPDVFALDAIHGFTAEPAGYDLSPDPLPDTDLFVVTLARNADVSLTKDKEAANFFTTLNVSEAGACPNGDARLDGLCTNDILLVTDCKKARIFHATKVDNASGEIKINHDGSGTPGNFPTSWGGASSPDDHFKDGAQILKMERVIYYLATGRSGRPSLWQHVGGVSLEILEGVEDMAITYGRDTNGDKVPDTYNTAAEINSAGATTWLAVSSVRLQLLVQSTDDNVVPEKQVYSFAGSDPKKAADLRLRQIFVSTVGIRSRLD